MLKIVLMLIAASLIILTLFQGGKTDGMSAFTGGGTLKLFENTKERGMEKTIVILTYVLGGAMMVLTGLVYMIR